MTRVFPPVWLIRGKSAFFISLSSDSSIFRIHSTFVICLLILFSVCFRIHCYRFSKLPLGIPVHLCSHISSPLVCSALRPLFNYSELPTCIPSPRQPRILPPKKKNIYPPGISFTRQAADNPVTSFQSHAKEIMRPILRPGLSLSLSLSRHVPGLVTHT